MIALGKKQELIVAKVVDFGVYLAKKKPRQRKILYCFQVNKCRKERKKAIN